MKNQMDDCLSPAEPDHEQALFAAALERPTSEREAFLDGACHRNAALRQRLEALLAAHEQPATELAGDDASTAVSGGVWCRQHKVLDINMLYPVLG